MKRGEETSRGGDGRCFQAGRMLKGRTLTSGLMRPPSDPLDTGPAFGFGWFLGCAPFCQARQVIFGENVSSGEEAQAVTERDNRS